MSASVEAFQHREQQAEPDDDAVERHIAQRPDMFKTPQEEEARHAEALDAALWAATVEDPPDTHISRL